MAKKQASIKNFRTLTRNEKIAGAKYLREKREMTYRKIGEWLGISEDSAMRYVNKYAIDDDIREEIEKYFAGVVRGMQLEGIHMVHKRLNELVPDETKISEVVKAGEFLSGGGARGGADVTLRIETKAKGLDEFVLDGEVVVDD